MRFLERKGVLPVSIEAIFSCGVFFCKIFENKALSAYVEISGVVFPAQIFFWGGEEGVKKLTEQKGKEKGDTLRRELKRSSERAHDFSPIVPKNYKKKKKRKENE